MERKMRILFVAMSDSIHTSRWICQLADRNWDLHLFPSIDSGVSHPGLKNVCIHHSIYGRQNSKRKKNRFRGIPVINNNIAYVFRGFLKTSFPRYRIRQLKRLIQKLQPDIIHSLEIQSAGYLTSNVLKICDSPSIPWIVSNWGSDIYLFGNLNQHVKKIQDVMENCDYYACECQRDVQLAKEFGFKGKILPVLPNSGGFDLNFLNEIRQDCKTSKRKKIILKGYQSWSGRALVGLRALERSADYLSEYEIVVYSASEEVRIAAELLQSKTGIPVRIIPLFTPHTEILKCMGQARIYLGLSISDALSTSAVEAMAMGAFPIQSDTSCLDELIENGNTGLLVSPNDPDVVEEALQRALTDDMLVDNAAKKNSILVRQYFDQKYVKPKVIEMYETVLKEKECYS